MTYYQFVFVRLVVQSSGHDGGGGCDSIATHFLFILSLCREDCVIKLFIISIRGWINTNNVLKVLMMRCVNQSQTNVWILFRDNKVCSMLLNLTSSLKRGEKTQSAKHTSELFNFQFTAIFFTKAAVSYFFDLGSSSPGYAKIFFTKVPKIKWGRNATLERRKNTSER